MFLLFLEVSFNLSFICSELLLQDREFYSDMVLCMLGLVGYPSDDINKFLWMVRIGGGVFPHIKEPDYLVRVDFFTNAVKNSCFVFPFWFGISVFSFL